MTAEAARRLQSGGGSGTTSSAASCYDEKAYATVEADCNLCIVPNGPTSMLMRIVGTDGGRRRLVCLP